MERLTFNNLISSIMEISVKIDLSTENGKRIFEFINTIVSAGTTAATTPGAKVVKLPTALPPVAAAPATPVIAPPAAPTAPVVSAPSLPPAAPVIAPPAITAPAVKPTAPITAPTAPAVKPKAPTAPAVPVVPFEQLDEEAKREALTKLTTKHSKKGKTADMKLLYQAYGATNVATVPVEYLDHFNWAINTYDGNGQDMNAVLSQFGS